MKPITAFPTFLALLLISASASPAQDTAIPQATPTTIPNDGNFKNHARWNIRCIERVGAMMGNPCDILFIGDSITQNFCEDPQGNWNVKEGLTSKPLAGENGFNLTGRSVWEKYYAPRRALNFGVGADGTEHMLWRMQNIDIHSFQPKAVVILAGTNDTPRYTAPQVAEGIKALVDKARTFFPHAHIILISILPSTREPQKILETNAIIKTFDDHRFIHYFDLNSKMVPEGKGWRGIGGDQIHLTPEGYQLWATEMEPLLAKILSLPRPE